MSLSSRLADDYYRRTGQPRDTGLDAAFAYQRTLLRDLMSRLEVILEDEGIPAEKAERVMRCLLYGSPSPAGAELRIEHEKELAKILMERPPMPLRLDGLDLVPEPLPLCLVLEDPQPDWMTSIAHAVPGEPMFGPPAERDRTTVYQRTGGVRDDGTRVYEAIREGRRR